MPNLTLVVDHNLLISQRALTDLLTEFKNKLYEQGYYLKLVVLVSYADKFIDDQKIDYLMHQQTGMYRQYHLNFPVEEFIYKESSLKYVPQCLDRFLFNKHSISDKVFALREPDEHGNVDDLCIAKEQDGRFDSVIQINKASFEMGLNALFAQLARFMKPARLKKHRPALRIDTGVNQQGEMTGEESDSSTDEVDAYEQASLQERTAMTSHLTFHSKRSFNKLLGGRADTKEEDGVSSDSDDSYMMRV